MNKIIDADADVSFEIIKDTIIYRFDSKHSAVSGDFVAIYAEDYEINRSEIFNAENNTGKVSILKLEKLPIVEFPLEIRGIVLEKNITLPSIFFKNPDDVLNIVQWSGSDARIVSLTDSELICEIKINSLPSYSREFILFVNDTVCGKSKSRLSNKSKKTVSENHKIVFSLEKRIRDRDDIKIIDRSTDFVVLNTKIDWYALTKIISEVVEENRNSITQIKEEMRQISEQVKFITGTALEKSGFERMDIYYSLLNSKINRMNLLYGSTCEKDISDQFTAMHDVDVSNQVEIKLREIEGVGVYELEAEEDREWKWVGPRVTLAFKDIPRGARFVSLNFWNFKPETNSEGILIDVNGRLIKKDAHKSSDLWELHIPLTQHISKVIENTAIIHIHFKDYYHSNDDTRLLSAVLNSARYEF